MKYTGVKAEEKNGEKKEEKAEIIPKEKEVPRRDEEENTLHHILMQLRKAANNPLLFRSIYNDEKIQQIEDALRISEQQEAMKEDEDALPSLKLEEDMPPVGSLFEEEADLEEKKVIEPVKEEPKSPEKSPETIVDEKEEEEEQEDERQPKLAEEEDEVCGFCGQVLCSLI
jgi:hypothetical protein